jgi:hypothetical protein
MSNKVVDFCEAVEKRVMGVSVEVSEFRHGNDGMILEEKEFIRKAVEKLVKIHIFL